MRRNVQVCIPFTKQDAFDYEIEDGIESPIGSRVWVPFHNSTRLGIIIGQAPATYDKSLKAIINIIDNTPCIPEILLNLCRFISRYYQTPLSDVIPLALPKRLRLGKEAAYPYATLYKLSTSHQTLRAILKTKAHQQHNLLSLFSDENHTLSHEALCQAGFTKAQLNAYEKKGLLTTQKQLNLGTFCGQGYEHPLTLTDEQLNALKTIQQTDTTYHCYLLQGVTGSGKTEVYLQLIADKLQKGQQVLILVPEIGLTPQLLDRFNARFSVPIAVLHSDITDNARATIWQLAKENHIKLVIGTRMALFTPMPTLGLIIVDEEHDASFKQDNSVRYSARDCALMRAYMANIPILLASATPSLETYYNAHNKKYTLLKLTQKALNQIPLHYDICDLRCHRAQEGLSEYAIGAIAKTLAAGQQVLVFVNRRGFSPVLLCHRCGGMFDCHACDSHLTVHSHMNHLLCHHCGFKKNIPTHCERCHSSELIRLGTGTQRLEAHLKETFPDVAHIRIDRDCVQKKEAFNKALDLIHQNKVQLLIGTQMLAKGHHFPRLALVVIVDADAGLYNQDFKALEQLGQLMTQVAGRAGRADHPGHVIIQTHIPDHPLLNLLIQQGYDAFAHALLKSRQMAALPPYQYLSLIRAKGRSESAISQFLNEIKQSLAKEPVNILGPAPAPLTRQASYYQWQLLIKAPSRQTLQLTLRKIREWISTKRAYRNMQWSIDVDPYDLS